MRRHGRSRRGAAGSRAAAALRCAAAAGVLLAAVSCSRKPAPKASAPLAAPREIASPAPAGSSEPRLSGGGDGPALLSWVEPAPGGGHRLMFARLEGEAFGPGARVA